MNRIVLIHEEDLRELIESATRRAVSEALRFQAAEVEAVRRSIRLLLSAAEVGEILGCTARRVMEYHAKRGLRAHRPGKSPVFLVADVEDYVRRFPQR